MLSFFEIPKVLRKLDYCRSRFFLQDDGPNKTYRLAKWSILCRPKEQGARILRYKILMYRTNVFLVNGFSI
jgi:hypothetical protein